MVMNATPQQVLSHNISNVQTPGFKQILTTATGFMQDQAAYSNGNLQASPIEYVGNMGLGTQIGQEFVDYGQGAMQNTGNPLDFALQGNGFFTVKTPDGNRYTRDGGFLRDAGHTLVSGGGFQVLGDNCPGLEFLDLSHTAISPESLIKLYRQLKRLHFLDITVI